MVWFDFILKISALVGGILAIWTFRRTVRVRRAEWLSNLHSRFFEAEGYKRIRRTLDDESSADFVKLRGEIADNRSSELTEAFVDYLNFFELVASLRKLRQLKWIEISMLFNYYLRLLGRYNFVRTYIKQHGFEELDALLEECIEVKK